MRNTLTWTWLGLLFGMIILLDSLTPLVAAFPVPDPCKLITVAELEQIVGKLKEGPKPIKEGGQISCDYTVAKDSSWLDITLHEGNFDQVKKSFGGKNPLHVPELGKDAFVNSNYEDFSAELFVKKGDVVLRVSLPKGPTAVGKIKEIAKKALPRL